MTSMYTSHRPTPDISRIPLSDEKVKKLFHKRLNPVKDFGTLRTLHLPDDLASYARQVDRFDYPADINSVWLHYTQRKPHEIWSGSLTPYLFTHSKKNRCFYYPDDPEAPEIHAGMQFFCLINIVFPLGLVGMEILEINAEKYTIEFAYIEGGLYRGTQRLEFVEQVNGGTRIIHTSYYRPENLLVWLIPYKFFHKKTINEFHQGMKNKFSNR
ncbi:MAG: hypothetical protein SF052_11665 [Bacteroidia bacterium]|nr:hypothetical protein [Bacteroidia bacterium]